MHSLISPPERQRAYNMFYDTDMHNVYDALCNRFYQAGLLKATMQAQRPLIHSVTLFAVANAATITRYRELLAFTTKPY